MTKLIIFLFTIIIFTVGTSQGQLTIKSGNNTESTPAPAPKQPLQSAPVATPATPAKPKPVVSEKKEVQLVKDPEMITVEGGTFTMGNEDFPLEKPAHSVTLSSFSIGKYEITQEQWFKVMGNHPALHENCDNCPVENVSWNEVQDFLNKLSKKTGKKYRLPTEAEWEFAAKGGVNSKHYSYSGSNNSGEVGWCMDNSNNETHPVGLKTPNELGIYDMCGNVSEWCSDFFDKEYYKNSPAENPQGGTGTAKIRRGGAFNDKAAGNCRNSCRNTAQQDIRQNYFGFRVCRSL